MGRPYAIELQLLPRTYRWAYEADIQDLTGAIDRLRELPLLIVGSGGSTSACHLVALLHEDRARLPARVLTPLEFVNHPRPQGAGVLMLSAGGRNPDILAAARHAIDAEYDIVAALCTRSRTPLAKTLAPHRHAAAMEFVGPSRKDGFLATNSLVQTCVLMARAYGAELPVELPSLTRVPEISDEGDLAELLNRPNLVVLADGWSVPAAMDIESKWSESGFGSVTVTDSRNFAHGRHLGLSRRRSETTVLGLLIGEANRATDQTLGQLQGVAQVTRLSTDLSCAAGAIDLVARAITVAGAVGRLRGLDPGRPHVPKFGRALYRARLGNRPATRQSASEQVQDIWITRKVTPAVWVAASTAARANWRQQLGTWRRDIESRSIGGLVLDYDGTVAERCERASSQSALVGSTLTGLIEKGLIVGIATGRGTSIVDALRGLFAEPAWSKVIVGMYNASVLFRLSDDPILPTSQHPSIALAYEILRTSPALDGLIQIHARTTQLSIRGTKPVPRALLYRFVSEALVAAHLQREVTIVSSGHSVDVILASITKRRVVDEVQTELLHRGTGDLDVITIGDQGQLGGNDSALLAHPLGLSVEGVSSVFSGCWNVTAQGTRRTAALLSYIKQLKRGRTAGFRWTVPKVGPALSGDAHGARTPAAKRVARKAR